MYSNTDKLPKTALLVFFLCISYTPILKFKITLQHLMPDATVVLYKGTSKRLWVGGRNEIKTGAHFGVKIFISAYFFHSMHFS